MGEDRPPVNRVAAGDALRVRVRRGGMAPFHRRAGFRQVQRVEEVLIGRQHMHRVAHDNGRAFLSPDHAGREGEGDLEPHSPTPNSVAMAHKLKPPPATISSRRDRSLLKSSQIGRILPEGFSLHLLHFLRGGGPPAHRSTDERHAVVFDDRRDLGLPRRDDPVQPAAQRPVLPPADGISEDQRDDIGPRPPPLRAAGKRPSGGRTIRRAAPRPRRCPRHRARPPRSDGQAIGLGIVAEDRIAREIHDDPQRCQRMCGRGVPATVAHQMHPDPERAQPRVLQPADLHPPVGARGEDLGRAATGPRRQQRVQLGRPDHQVAAEGVKPFAQEAAPLRHPAAAPGPARTVRRCGSRTPRRGHPRKACCWGRCRPATEPVGQGPSPSGCRPRDEACLPSAGPSSGPGQGGSAAGHHRDDDLGQADQQMRPPDDVGKAEEPGETASSAPLAMSRPRWTSRGITLATLSS